MIIVQPKDINAKQHFFNGFDNSEREIPASWIVHFCQVRARGWEPFTKDDIERFYNGYGYTNFWFNGLIEPKYGIVLIGSVYHIEHNFVARCWLASPVECS